METFSTTRKRGEGMHYCSSMYAPLKHVIIKHPKDAFKSQEHLADEWKTFNYLSEPNYQEALIEYAEFIAVLEKYVEQIDYLPASNEVGLDSLYAHDPVKFTPHGAIILKSGKKLRQPEAVVYKEFLQDKGIRLLGVDVPSVDPADCKVVSAHHSLHRSDVHILENVMLGHVEPGNYELIALPLAIEGADGSPVRAVVRPLD